MKYSFIIAVLIFCFCCNQIHAAEKLETLTKEKKADILKLLEVTGTSKMAAQMMKSMFDSFKQADPRIPEEFWDTFAAEVDHNELIDIYIPIYDKYFSHEEIKEFIVFWESPLGKKLVKRQPAIIQESMEKGQIWGQKVAQRALMKLQSQAEGQ